MNPQYGIEKKALLFSFISAKYLNHFLEQSDSETCLKHSKLQQVIKKGILKPFQPGFHYLQFRGR